MGTESLYNTIDELREDAVGVLVVTHDVSAAFPHATKVLEVRNGAAVLSDVEAGNGEGGAA